MSAFSSIIFVAGPVDVALTIVVVGTVLVALAVHVLVAIGWIRRRP
jgi:hypothetical protein